MAWACHARTHALRRGRRLAGRQLQHGATGVRRGVRRDLPRGHQAAAGRWLRRRQPPRGLPHVRLGAARPGAVLVPAGAAHLAGAAGQGAASGGKGSRRARAGNAVAGLVHGVPPAPGTIGMCRGMCWLAAACPAVHLGSLGARRTSHLRLRRMAHLAAWPAGTCEGQGRRTSLPGWHDGPPSPAAQPAARSTAGWPPPPGAGGGRRCSRRAAPAGSSKPSAPSHSMHVSQGRFEQPVRATSNEKAAADISGHLHADQARIFH